MLKWSKTFKFTKNFIFILQSNPYVMKLSIVDNEVILSVCLCWLFTNSMLNEQF